ncbi:MAG TPA: molybdate ABC transporter substrate-binding protein [Nocardioidaceae bacterium]|nr:molybdate ABC transporter substrate-binding protein [Nocardioidaceae bacterium]
MTRIFRVATLAAVAVLGLSSCGGDDGGSGGDKTKLTVFAASSLTNTFGELEKAFEKDHPDVDVVISFDSSSTLATQITSGSPADVLVTADQASMQIIVDAGDNAATPQPFASNTMAVVTPPDNPAGITSVSNIDKGDFVVCDPSAPCGEVAAQILEKAGVTAKPVSYGEKVTAVLETVELGEADAGMVYITDAQGAGDQVHAIDIPDNLNVVTPYYIAAVKDSANADLATEWISLVESEAGQSVLEKAGFGAP